MAHNFVSNVGGYIYLSTAPITQSKNPWWPLIGNIYTYHKIEQQLNFGHIKEYNRSQ
jgi:hypothetical protein